MLKNKSYNWIKRAAAGVLVCLALCGLFARPLLAGQADSGSDISGSKVASQGGDTSASAQSTSTSASVVAQNPAEGNGLYQPEDFEVQAEAVCLVNGESGAVVYQKNANKPFASASLVKMMTCILLLEHVEDLDAPTIAADVTVFNELVGKNASHADIWRGETLTARELLYAMLLPSANEAALITAQYVSGGYVKNFVYMMNGKAKNLGCTGTVFEDPTGLAPESVTTAYDMYLITQEFMRHPELVEIAAAGTYEMPAHDHPAPYNIFNTNRLIVPDDAYARQFSSISGAVKAGKTGSLGEWQNFASMAEKDGETYYCVVLHSPDAADKIAPILDNGSVRPALYETGLLYEWVFKNYGVMPALDTEQPITEVRVKYSTQQDSVRLLPTSDVKTVLPRDGSQQVEKVFDLPEFLPAPVEKGQVAGTVTLVISGQPVGTSQLVISQDVARNTTLYVMEKVKEFFASPIFRIVLVVLVVVIVGYVCLAMMSYRKKMAAGGPGARGAPPKGAGTTRPNGPTANKNGRRRDDRHK